MTACPNLPSVHCCNAVFCHVSLACARLCDLSCFGSAHFVTTYIAVLFEQLKPAESGNTEALTGYVTPKSAPPSTGISMLGTELSPCAWSLLLNIHFCAADCSSPVKLPQKHAQHESQAQEGQASASPAKAQEDLVNRSPASMQALGHSGANVFVQVGFVRYAVCCLGCTGATRLDCFLARISCTVDTTESTSLLF